MLEPGARHILLLFAIFAHRNLYAADADMSESVWSYCYDVRAVNVSVCKLYQFYDAASNIQNPKYRNRCLQKPWCIKTKQSIVSNISPWML